MIETIVKFSLNLAERLQRRKEPENNSLRLCV